MVRHMKELILIRHATAGWGEVGHTDFDRTLTADGEVEARAMAERLAASGVRPERLVSSPAIRAESTAAPIAAALGLVGDPWLREPRVYEAGVSDLLDLCQGLDETFDRAALVGHNPGFADLGKVLSREAPRGLPPAGVIRMHFEIGSWSELGRGLAVRTECFFPGDPT